MSKEIDPAEIARAEFNAKVEGELDLIRSGRRSVRSLPRDSEVSDAVISRMVYDRPSSFADLAPDQFTEEGAYLYVRDCLSKTDTTAKEKLFYETFDGHAALALTYSGTGDDIIEYFDPALEIPAWLSVNASVNVTVERALDLLRALNVDVHRFGTERLVRTLHDRLTVIIRRELLAYIDENKLGFFNFESKYDEMSVRLQEALDAEMTELGLHVIAFRLRRISMSEEIADMVRREYFAARKLSIRAEAEEKWAESSTKMLEKKASIIANYKISDDTLTEMEKDKALERYLRKVNNIRENDNYSGDRPEGAGMLFERQRPVCPVEPPMVKMWQVVLCIIAACGLAVGAGVLVIMKMLPVAIALAVLSAGMIALTVILIVRRFAERGIRFDYQLKLHDYGHELEEYERYRREAYARLNTK